MIRETGILDSFADMFHTYTHSPVTFFDTNQPSYIYFAFLLEYYERFDFLNKNKGVGKKV